MTVAIISLAAVAIVTILCCSSIIFKVIDNSRIRMETFDEVITYINNHCTDAHIIEWIHDHKTEMKNHFKTDI